MLSERALNRMVRIPAIAHNTRKLTKPELARYLRRLAELNSDPHTGNRRLREALLELAHELMEDSRARLAKETGKRDAGGDAAPPPGQEVGYQAAFSWLRSMDQAAVTAFISDGSKTKAELIDLASERFSIPRARLSKLSIPEVREEIRSALLHEESLRLISKEAERAGSNRSS